MALPLRVTDKRPKAVDFGDRNAVKAYLIENGNPAAESALYADAYVEFGEASKNIQESGAVTLNPLTGAAMENPYLKVRDRAAQRLERMNSDVDSEGLW